MAVSLMPGTAPRRCYIGLVQIADEYGVRMNIVDWDDGSNRIRVHSEDLFAPWTSITSMLVCTQEEPKRRFLKDGAPAWQAEVESMDTKG